MEDNKLITNLKSAIERAKSKIIYNVNSELLKLYMYIGDQINKELKTNDAHNKNQTISSISSELTKEFGSGYSRRNIKAMLNFYIIYKNWETLFPTLSWGHYFSLLGLKNDQERKFYEIECAKQRWSVRDLKRQIQSGYYQRILLGSKQNMQIKSDQLSTIGNQIVEPRDVLVDPIVINFFKKRSDLKEKDIENGIVTHMKEFLLELGSGFKFIDNQYQFIIDNKKYFVDLVFYNETLKCYVLIELKAVPFQKEAMGQINTYLNYFKDNINKQDDNDPIGIVMCTDFNHIQVEYATGNITNKIFVTKYITYLPRKEELEKELLAAQKHH